MASKALKQYNNIANEIVDIESYIGYIDIDGYVDIDIYGVEVDYENKTFVRLAGAVGKTPGADFDSIKAFGGRKRCILTDDGVVLAYYGEPGYVETGKLTQAITKNGVTYPVGTPVQVMVEHMKDSPYPVLVCGDFNDVPWSYTYQQISNLATDAFVKSGKGFGNTFLVNHKIPFRIDYIFYDEKAFDTFDFTVRKVNYSDHFPILALLTFKN